MHHIQGMAVTEGLQFNRHAAVCQRKVSVPPVPAPPHLGHLRKEATCLELCQAPAAFESLGTSSPMPMLELLSGALLLSAPRLPKSVPFTYSITM